MVEILQYQFAKGYASGLDVAAQESQLAQVTATLPPLLKQSTQLRDLLAVLAGRFPSQAPAEKFELASLQLPEELPLSLPSELVAQRPDVLQAEANLHAASAQIGIAIANRLPNITLTANAGSTALAMTRCSPPARASGPWARRLTAPLFQGGTLLHQERAAKAAYVQAAEQYRSTVLTAFQNVADTLTALEQDAEGLKAAAAAAETRQGHARLVATAMAGRLRQLSCAAERRTSLSAGADQPGAGAGQSLCRYGGAVSGAGRRLVAPRGFSQG